MYTIILHVGQDSNCARLSAVEHEFVSLPTSSCQQSLTTTRARNDVTCCETTMTECVGKVQAHRRLNRENFDEAEFPVEKRVNWLLNSETDVKHV